MQGWQTAAVDQLHGESFYIPMTLVYGHTVDVSVISFIITLFYNTDNNNVTVFFSTIDAIIEYKSRDYVKISWCGRIFPMDPSPFSPSILWSGGSGLLLGESIVW